MSTLIFHEDLQEKLLGHSEPQVEVLKNEVKKILDCCSSYWISSGEKNRVDYLVQEPELNVLFALAVFSDSFM